MNWATRFRIAGTPIECEYAPTLPISLRSDRARSMASLGKMDEVEGWSRRSGYSVKADTCANRIQSVRIRSVIPLPCPLSQYNAIQPRDKQQPVLPHLTRRRGIPSSSPERARRANSELTCRKNVRGF